VRGKSTSTKRTSMQVRRRDVAGRGLDIRARMHGQRRIGRGWILGRLHLVIRNQEIKKFSI
jgi:hypothetical protein